MVDAKIVAAYKAARQKHPGLSARIAYQWALPKQPGRIEWNANDDRGEYTEGVIRVHVRIEPDDDTSDMSYHFQGKFTDRPGHNEYAIDRVKTKHMSEREVGRYYRYFVPDEHPESVRKHLRKTHGKHEAYTLAMKQARQTHEYAERLSDGHVPVYGIVAKAYIDGREMGDSSCWGFTIDDEASHRENLAFLHSEAEDIAREALEDAKRNAKSFVKTLTDAALGDD